MSFKEKLTDLAAAARDAETLARGLNNQNLADVIGLGAARFEQALQHADIDKVDEAVSKAAGQGAMPFDPAAGNQGGAQQ